MKKLLLGLSFALVAFLFAAQGSHAQAADAGFSGKAVRWNGDPISGATIRVLAGPLETDKEYARSVTAADGSWSVTVAPGGPYWVHIDTLGTWWGYSYQTPFTLQAGEQVSQLFLALGPRDVQEITLPTPVSNGGGEVGSATPTPVSDVEGVVGGEPEGPTPGMPSTGGNDGGINGMELLIISATLLAVGGLTMRLVAGKAE